jgi:glycosyltransferase involved in cell wall biosynthesis
MIAINGRFLTQRLTGVQRVCAEILRAFDALDGPPMRLLVPPGSAAPTLARIAVEEVGSGAGQFWEQRALPAAARGQVLLNLGNTAPMLAGRRQAVVIHDAGAFDTPGSYSFAFRTWYRLLHRALAARGARIVTVSDFSRQRIAHHLRLDPAAIAVMPEGSEHILREPADVSVLTRHGLVAQNYALVVGSRAAHKNLAVLADAAAWLRARGFVLAAVGALDANVFRTDEGAPGAVALGRVTDAELRALYEHARCLIFPSAYEGFGLPPLEAMACFCPVLAARAASVPEVCGEAALWFAPDDPASLLAGLARLEEPGVADSLRTAGLARAKTFTWRGAAETLLSKLPA